MKNITLDDGYSFGRGCFETILVKDKPVLLKEHIKRLNDSLKILKIDKTITVNEVMDKIEALKIRDKALKIMVSRENVIYNSREIAYKESDYSKGFNITMSNVKRNENSDLTYIKSLNYLENIIEKEKAKNKGFDEVIFLNTENYIAEGAVSNVFFIKNDIIYTPSIECGILPGIIRGFLVDNIENIGYKIVKGRFTKDELLNCDGAFITNSLMGIMKINSLDNIKINENHMVDKIRSYYVSTLK
ncbi:MULTISPECIES: aminotransferase class IV [Clostridium]|uniref:4-amino-4-deoxychorismate lyase n=1 Tax=Clostridium senegalense TaxID=1465809 RepID=A0A6M0H2H5_9CLOT|nr:MULTISPECIES: aminotransferase class IV [Clostridium]NEU04936.1 4-amino-4-deoxychorismate lyase [Clostridium senegalense]